MFHTENNKLHILFFVGEDVLSYEQKRDISIHLEAIESKGWRVSFLVRKELLLQDFRVSDLNVFDYAFFKNTLLEGNVSALGEFDVIHAHTQSGVNDAQELAESLCIPLVTSFYAEQRKSLNEQGCLANRVFCKSEAIRDSLVIHSQVLPYDTKVAPVHSANTTFCPSQAHRQKRLEAIEIYFQEPLLEKDRVLVISIKRGTDEQSIINKIKDAWTEQIQKYTFSWRFIVNVNHNCRQLLGPLADSINEAAKRTCIQFLDDVNEQIEAALFKSADLILTSEFDVYKAIACGRPVIAIGIYEYIGIVNQSTWNRGNHTRFDGEVNTPDSYRLGTLYSDIDSIIYDDEKLDDLGSYGLLKAEDNFAQSRYSEWLTKQYCEVVESHRCSKLYSNCWKKVHNFATDFFNSQESSKLAAPWSVDLSKNVRLKQLSGGKLQVTCEFENDEGVYLKTGDSGFEEPMTNEDSWSCFENHMYEFSGELKVVSGNVLVKIWILEYAEKRLNHITKKISEGTFRISHKIINAGRTIRFAIKLSGKGIVHLSPINVFSKPINLYQPSPRALKNTPRDTKWRGFNQYKGKNLIFILGAPRSGTTWLLKLLSGHPRVEAATVDNLNVRMNDSKTLETNIFTPNRPFTDNSIKESFYQLSRQHPGKIIVEKTPIHTIHHGRIDHIFPHAAFIIIERDPRDIITSLLHVGRDKNAWWQGAPDTAEKASKLWLQYATAIERCKQVYSPFCLKYEDMLLDPFIILKPILTGLGLSIDTLNDMIHESSKGENIGIKKVFRSGAHGDWKNYLTSQELATFYEIAGEYMSS